MTDSISSLTSRDVSSNVSLHHGIDNGLSTRAIYEMNPSDIDLSRSLSRCSMNSGLSITAAKDGIQGERVIRTGINQYSLNLLEPKHFNNNNNTNHTTNKKYKQAQYPYHFSNNNNSNNNNNKVSSTSRFLLDSDNEIQDFDLNKLSECSTPTYPDFPNSPPMTLREKMKLLNTEKYNLPVVSMARINNNNKSIDSFDDSVNFNSSQISSISIDNLLQNDHPSIKLKPRKTFHKNINEYDQVIENNVNGNDNRNNIGDILNENFEIDIDNDDDNYITSNESNNLNLIFTPTNEDLHINHPSITSELESTASTLGDDISYLYNFKLQK